MIKLTSKTDCCGCAACASVCAHKCITLKADAEGFLYPEVDADACVNCGLCEKVCPIISVPQQNSVLEVFAAKNKNENERFHSSSGGLFRLIAEKILQDGGVVFGCRLDERQKAYHAYAETKDQLDALMSSKYVQSDTRGIFEKVRSKLKEGKKVLFSGTPCQVAALKNFLFKPYDNLITKDILCHGVPSPKVFKEYVEGLEKRYECKVKSVNFRWKEKSWKRLYINAELSNGKRHFLYSGYDSYMQLFLSDSLQRPSCFECPYNTLSRPGDLSLGDFWGIGKTNYDFDDNKGISMVLINNDKGLELWNQIEPETTNIKSDIETAIAGNRVLVAHLPSSENRDRFYSDYVKNGFDNAVAQYAPEASKAKQLYYNFMRMGLDILRRIKRKSY